MRFLSKAILVLESNLLRIYVEEAGVDLGCAAPSFCLCVCSICVCLGFVCVKKCLWLCLGICNCVCAYVYQCHRCQRNICFWVYVNFCSRKNVGCCKERLGVSDLLLWKIHSCASRVNSCFVAALVENLSFIWYLVLRSAVKDGNFISILETNLSFHFD